MLLHLPEDRSAEQVRDALVTTVATLPAHLRKSLIWDQGLEMGRRRELGITADLPIYFCDPASP